MIVLILLGQIHLLKLTDKGHVGKAWKVQHRDTGQIFAMKVLNKAEMLKRNKVIN